MREEGWRGDGVGKKDGRVWKTKKMIAGSNQEGEGKRGNRRTCARRGRGGLCK